MSITGSSIEMRVGIAILFVGLINACGGGHSTSSSSPAPQPPPNNPPTISGSPSTTVTQGQPYSFTPVANDLEGDRLTFSISILPAWASFDSGTGSLTGTPEAEHVGTTLDVTISVSDGTATASLTPFDLEVQRIRLGSAIVSWDIPTTNADGSTLIDLDGFNVHYGRASLTYTRLEEVNDESLSSVLIGDLEPGTWFFAVTAFDLAGNESAPSTEVSKVVNP